jgi:hypothetical protein
LETVKLILGGVLFVAIAYGLYKLYKVQAARK